MEGRERANQAKNEEERELLRAALLMVGSFFYPGRILVLWFDNTFQGFCWFRQFATFEAFFIPTIL